MVSAMKVHAPEFVGTRVSVRSRGARASRPGASVVVASGGKKITPKGLSSVKDDVVRNNLMGTSRKMKDKNWVDSQGRKGKGYGVYRFQDKYGANVDGYSPIYTPDIWSESGSSYKPGKFALAAWAGLLAVGLVVAASLIYQTSALAN